MSDDGKRLLRRDLDAEPALLLVLGDFGRDAGLRFCQAFARGERRRLQRALPEISTFFDEHRVATMSLVGDLPFVKQRALRSYQERDRPLDERLLVGFPCGMPIADIVPRLGVLALEGMLGTVTRGGSRVLCVLPCNTLAPASWSLHDHFQSAASLQAMLEAAGAADRSDLARLAERVPAEVSISFPTVPEAVVAAVEQSGAGPLLPLGTKGIEAAYAEAIKRRASSVCLAPLRSEWQDATLAAIRASVSGGAARNAAREGLRCIADEARSAYGEAVAIVEACTDLDYGVGLDSAAIYAESAVSHVYGSSAT